METCHFKNTTLRNILFYERVQFRIGRSQMQREKTEAETQHMT